MAAKRCCVDEDRTEIESEIAHHLIDQSDSNFVKMHVLIHFSDYIRLLGYLLDVRSELPEKPMMDLTQAYQRSNHDEVSFRIVQTNA